MPTVIAPFLFAKLIASIRKAYYATLETELVVDGNVLKVTPAEVPNQPQKPVDDAGTVAVNAHFKIFDPSTQEVFVEERG